MSDDQPTPEQVREMERARQEWLAHKAEPDQEDCLHQEHDHFICLECGKDLFDDFVGRAENMRDAREDR